MHVFKKHWHNEKRKGIHFETYIGIGVHEVRKHEIVLALHPFDAPVIPGTRLKRIHLSKIVVDSCYELVSSREGYHFRAGKYGMHAFSRSLSYAI